MWNCRVFFCFQKCRYNCRSTFCTLNFGLHARSTQVWLILLIEWAIIGIVFEIIDRFNACQKYRLQPNVVVSNKTKIRFDKFDAYALYQYWVFPRSTLQCTESCLDKPSFSVLDHRQQVCGGFIFWNFSAWSRNIDVRHHTSNYLRDGQHILLAFFPNFLRHRWPLVLWLS